jgi:hypothetical protein
MNEIIGLHNLPEGIKCLMFEQHRENYPLVGRKGRKLFCFKVGELIITEEENFLCYLSKRIVDSTQSESLRLVPVGSI